MWPSLHFFLPMQNTNEVGNPAAICERPSTCFPPCLPIKRRFIWKRLFQTLEIHSTFPAENVSSRSQDAQKPSVWLCNRRGAHFRLLAVSQISDQTLSKTFHANKRYARMKRTNKKSAIKEPVNQLTSITEIVVVSVAFLVEWNI